MQSLTFERTNGNIPRKLTGEDHISGIMFYTDTLPSGFTETERIKAVSQIETAEKLGITADAEAWSVRLVHYQLSEVFRLNPGISLYVGIFPKAEGTNTYADVKKMQNFAGGRLRQIGVWEGDVAFSKENLTALQGVATTLESQDMPLSILYAPKVAAIASLPTDAAGDKERVSVIIGQAGSSTGAALYADEDNTTAKASVSGLGVLLGIVSSASVQESPAWIEKFPTGIDVPAFGDGTLLTALDRTVVESLIRPATCSS